MQLAKNLTDGEDRFWNGKRYLLMDRDEKSSTAFRSLLAQSGIESVRLPRRSPHLNSSLERLNRSIEKNVSIG